ncbi:MAG: ATP-dependent Clp protease proteolytic subunit [Clostridiales bacterium]|nr:ATP-dependent Clp protease proteolytic subunit [Clostridiales bacterium]
MKLQLNGTVTTNDDAMLYRYFGFNDVCCPEDIRKALENTPDGEELTLEINSGGGSAFAGFEMYTVLRNARGRVPVTAEVQSIAASAMSVVIAACDTVKISPVATVMIHRSSASASGNAEVHGQAKQMLETVDKGILSAYCEKAGAKCTRAKFRSMMKQETYLTAEEAVACGLADELLEAEGDEGTTQPMMVAAAIQGARAGMGGLPDIERLREIKALAEQTEGKAPEEQPCGEEADGKEPTVSEGESPSHNQTEKEQNDMEEIKTVEDLMKAYPELTDSIRTSAAEQATAAEQNRIKDIESCAVPGFEDIVEEAKADTGKDGSYVARQIVARQKAQGAGYLQQRNADAEDAGANNVPQDSSEGQKEDPEAELSAAVKGAVADFEKGVN